MWCEQKRAPLPGSDVRLLLLIGFVERPYLYRMCRRCTEGVQKVYRRCTEECTEECTEGLIEKKAACALTGWLYDPAAGRAAGLPRRDAAAQPICAAFFPSSAQTARAARSVFAYRPGGLVYTSKLKPGAAGHKEERRLKWRRRLPGPSAHQ